MTSSTPTLEQFMSEHQPEEDDDLDQAPAGGDPLASIAHSLDRMLAIAEHHQLEETEADRLREAHDDLDAKYAALFDLLDEVEAIVKPSTSKLANTVREAIGRWRDPQVEHQAPEPVVPDPAAAPAADPGPVAPPAAPAADELPKLVHAKGEADLIGACGTAGPTTNAAVYVTCPDCPQV